MAKKDEHPFFCEKKKCRKTLWDTPEYLTEGDWGVIRKVLGWITRRNMTAIYAWICQEDSGEARDFFHRVVGWPEGLKYCTGVSYFLKTGQYSFRAWENVFREALSARDSGKTSIWTGTDPAEGPVYEHCVVINSNGDVGGWLKAIHPLTAEVWRDRVAEADGVHGCYQNPEGDNRDPHLVWCAKKLPPIHFIATFIRRCWQINCWVVTEEPPGPLAAARCT